MHTVKLTPLKAMIFNYLSDGEKRTTADITAYTGESSADALMQLLSHKRLDISREYIKGKWHWFRATPEEQYNIITLGTKPKKKYKPRKPKSEASQEPTLSTNSNAAINAITALIEENERLRGILKNIGATTSEFS